MFFLQLFGDNDTVSAENILTIGFKRSDNTLQKYNIPNPKSDLTVQQIQTAMNTARGSDAAPTFIDSKTGGNLPDDSVTKGTAYKTEQTIRDLDLTDTGTAVTETTTNSEG